MTTTAAARAVSFDKFDRYSQLFLDYCSGDPHILSFYRYDFSDPSSFEEAAVRAAEYDRDRSLLVDILLEQNRRWGVGDRSLEQIEHLRSPDSVAVVTGQQVGLFTGPMYTILKTITALQYAREMRSKTGRHVVPVFWLEGEDHDVAEVARLHLMGRNDPLTLTYEPTEVEEEAHHGPVGRITLTDRINTFLEEVEEAVPPSDFRDKVLDAMRASYRPGVTLLDAFAGFMRRLFVDEGLVFFSVDDPRAKKLLTPLFKQEIRRPDETLQILREATDGLTAEYSAQIRPNLLNVFLLTEQGRLRLEQDGKSFSLRGADRSFELDELDRLLEEQPEIFSPNVVLRPLAQDRILPTAAYIAGPGEIAYFAQLGGLYEHFDIPMPIIYPRACATLVEPNVARILDKFELDVTSFRGDINVLVRSVVLEEMDVDIEAGFDEALAAIDRGVDKLVALAAEVDQTLEKSAESSRTGIHNQLEGLRNKLEKAAKRNEDQTTSSLQRAASHLFPNGSLQERTISPVYFMTKYGFDLPKKLLGEVSLDTSRHQLIDL